ncbi:MAG: Dethiobiotin synthetase, partial [Oscillatoriales cyanobacterium RM1_1_9]|nr:Dethiobiotin synthetase [Oscillatoriales cyanobacterium RM1_1_9]
MDYKTAHNLILEQGNALNARTNSDAFLSRLEQGKPPIPGQVTSILLALKILFDSLKEEPAFEQQLTAALYQFGYGEPSSI